MAADKDQKLDTLGKAKTIVMSAMSSYSFTVTPETHTLVEQILDDIFKNAKSGLAGVTPPHFSEKEIVQKIALVRKDYDLGGNHPLGDVRFKHALTKGLIEIAQIGGKPENAEKKRKTLFHVYEARLVEDIKKQDSTQLKEFIFPEGKENQKNLNKFYAVLGCGEQQKYNDVLNGKEVDLADPESTKLTTKDEIVNALAEALKEKFSNRNDTTGGAKSAYSWVEKKSRATFTPEKITEIVQKAVTDHNASNNQTHPLEGTRFLYTLAKLMIENAEITGKKPENHRKDLANSLKQRFRETILEDRKKAKDKRVFHPNLADVICEKKTNLVTGVYWKVNEQKLDALYNALGKADPKKFADLIKVVPVTLVDEQGYAVTPANIAKLAYQEAAKYESLNKPVPDRNKPVPITEVGLEGAVAELFKKLPTGTSAKLKPEDIEAAVAALSINQSSEFQIDEDKTVHGSLGTGGRLYVFEKLLIEELTIDPAKREAEAKDALTSDLKNRIKADILDKKIAYLEKEDFPGLITAKKQNRIDEERFDAFFETIGGEDTAQGWQIAQSGKIAAEEVNNKKTGFAGASVGNKLGIVGSAALGTFLLATSGEKEEPGKQTEPGKDPEKSAGWRPNFKAFLGIAALLGAALWTWKVMSQKGKGGPEITGI